MTTTEAQRFWEDLYGGRPKIWSGKVNAPLEQRVRDLPPGRALDLGCGEGADALWLAERSWVVTAVDISATALEHRGGVPADEVERRARQARSLPWTDRLKNSFFLPVSGTCLSVSRITQIWRPSPLSVSS